MDSKFPRTPEQLWEVVQSMKYADFGVFYLYTVNVSMLIFIREKVFICRDCGNCLLMCEEDDG